MSGESKRVMEKTASGLQSCEIKKAEAGAQKPKVGSMVTVHYVGTLENGKEFDSSRKRGKPFTFKVGVGQVIQGWDEGIMLMKVGEQRRLIIPAHLGYGAQGVPGVIPPNATLVFEVELLEVK